MMTYKKHWHPACSAHRFSPIAHCLSTILFLTSQTAMAREYLFSPSSLEGDALTHQNIDLSLFSRPDAQLPGAYSSRIMLNEEHRTDATITYLSNDKGILVPQITPEMLRQWGISVDQYPELVRLDPHRPLPQPLGSYIPQASAQLEFSSMTLRLSIPQVALASHSQGYISPSRWDDGVAMMFTDYSFSGSQNWNDENTDATQYLNLRNGFNLGGWRVRNYSTWSHSEDTQHWEAINTYAQHDIDALQSQFTAGQSSTRGEVFDSIQYEGMNLASDEEMLPYSQRGFAPVIRGVASTNAEVSVRQNGYLIYQQNVAPGAFEINDLYSTTNSGDLEVTVKEADGTEHHFTQPYSSVAIMLRPGHFKYEFTAARYRADSGSTQHEPLFSQGSLIYGLNNSITLFGGATVSEDYGALNTGAGIALGDLGSVSGDVTLAKAKLDNDIQSTGESYRLLYSGKLDTTGTNFTLGSYRYSSKGYYSFSDANQRYDDRENELLYSYNKRSRLQASISQNLAGASLYLNAYEQDYWHTSQTERSISSGINTVISGVSLHLTYTYSHINGEDSDQMVSAGFSVPLSQWLPHAWSSYNISNSKHGYTQQNLGLSGTLLEDQRLSYSLQQSQANHDGSDTSSVYGSYRSQYAIMNAGYASSSDNSQQLTYGASGAIIAHSEGITLSQPTGDQFAIVSAKGASGVHFQNQRGIQTDWLGNAIIPSLSAYQENNIRIDTNSLPEDVDTDETTITVIPTRNAAVTAHFAAHVGYRALINLTLPDGSLVPFGAIATTDAPVVSGIVDDTGTLYLAGVTDAFNVNVKWGNSSNQRCIASITLDEGSQTSPNGIRSTRAVCHQE